MGISTQTQPSTERRPRIPDDFVVMVSERADVLEIVQRSVKLKKSGGNYLGLCPFHSEKSPSFTVAPSKGFFHCFGCGASGGALNFLMEHDGLSFRDAVKEAALASGIPLCPELSDMPGQGVPAIETGPLYEAMTRSGKFFSHCLRHSPKAIAYLKKRGLNGETVKRFGIGYAPDEWRGLKEAFDDYEANPFLVQTGMIREKESIEGKAANRYDTFRNRITFPVRDTRGRIIAFGGRIIGEGDPKYLNSPESPLFHKSGALFGLFEAREAIRRDKLVLVVEGYMDVVMLAQHGIQAAVACMGTSLTRWHVERLLSQSQTVVFSFDGDAAGQNAAWRALETITPLLEDQHDIRFLVLPDGKDPDELVAAEGAAAFLERVRKAPSYSEHLFQVASQRNNGLATVEDRARFAAETSNIANRLSYKTKLRRIILDQIAQEAKLPGSAIAALTASSATRTIKMSVWARMGEAAGMAPDVALQERDIILTLLEETNPEEKDLADLLRAITPADAEEAASPANAGNTRWLMARDLLVGAIDVIVEHRQAQAVAQLKAEFQAGKLNERDFIRRSMELQAAAG